MKGFLDLPQETPLGKARYAVLPVAYDATVTYKRGTRNGPQAIIDASAEVELFDEEFKRPLDELKIHTCPAVGDNAEKPEKTVERVHDSVKSLLNNKECFPLVLGGEHSISVGAVRAALEKHSNLTVLYFDAHADLRNEFDGSAFNHACAARRMLDDGCRLVQVGIRSLDEEQYDLIKKTAENKLKVFWARDFENEDGSTHHALGAATAFERKIGEIASAVGSGPVWISFDLDAFDPSEMPAVGTPEPGGLHWRDVLRILRGGCANARVIGADVVELCPQQGLHYADFAAARLCVKILAYKEFLGSTGKTGGKARDKA